MMSKYTITQTRLYNGLGPSTRMIEAGTDVGDGTDYPCPDAVGEQLVAQGFARRRMVEDARASTMEEKAEFEAGPPETRAIERIVVLEDLPDDEVDDDE